MTKRFLVVAASLLAAVGALSFTPVAGARMTGNPVDASVVTTATDRTATQDGSDEAKGRAILARLQAGEVTCDALTDDDFDLIGDAAMGLMMGNAHDAMDAAMRARIGEQGDRAMHVAMGKRYSGCDANAGYGGTGTGFGMMGMMGYGGGMMGGWYPGAPYGGAYATGVATGAPSVVSLVTTGLVWILLIVGIIAVIQWIVTRRK